MAHPTDYQSMQDISKLKRSSPKTPPIENGYILITNFLDQNPNWAIDSLVTYLLHTYSDYGVTREMICKAIRNYIMSRS